MAGHTRGERAKGGRARPTEKRSSFVVAFCGFRFQAGPLMFLLSALAHGAVSAQDAEQSLLTPARLEPGHPGRLCLSTATNIRTVTCNVGCNSNQLHACPRACLCTAANITADVSRGMDSGAFRQLMGKLPKREPKLPAVSAARLADPIAPAAAATVSLPDDMTGFWMKTWFGRYA